MNCITKVSLFSGNRIQHPGKQTHLVEQWKKLVHGNVVPLREVLINCRAFDDSCKISQLTCSQFLC